MTWEERTGSTWNITRRGGGRNFTESWCQSERGVGGDTEETESFHQTKTRTHTSLIQQQISDHINTQAGPQITASWKWCHVSLLLHKWCFLPHHQSVINPNRYCQNPPKQKHGSNLIIVSFRKHWLIFLSQSCICLFVCLFVPVGGWLQPVSNPDIFLLLARSLVSTGSDQSAGCISCDVTQQFGPCLILVVQPEDIKWDAACWSQRWVS